jgi:ParB-like chromosome segregation protein Spo0J
MSSKTIKIKCTGAQTLPLDLILEFQGGLKKLSKQNLEKLKSNILKNGFVAPVFVWDDKGDYRILDGHQRIAALISLRQDGYDMPLIPVDTIDASDESEARKILLSITSQYGEFDLDELNEWISELDDDIAETLRFANDEIKLSDKAPEDDDEEGFEPAKLKISIKCNSVDQVNEISNYLLGHDVSFKVKK